MTRIRTTLAFWLLRRAARFDYRAVQLFAFNYCEQNYNEYQAWSINKAIGEYGP